MNNYQLSSRQNALFGFFVEALASLFVQVLFFSGPVEFHRTIGSGIGLGFAFFIISPIKQ
ncbi:hypothetical protein [Halorubrum lipolyticum]|jgi:hypothetical protein|uniref:hypothetical protein n=1 Tax=Halorubrum lipolyticum TaxID=368624 RepID=UPI0011C9DF0F|nr:hypothetical protein [Halorubrum lipolyticum]